MASGSARSIAGLVKINRASATTNPVTVLDVLVEGMGHINFAQALIDRKGITDRVTLAGMTLMNWGDLSAAARGGVDRGRGVRAAAARGFQVAPLRPRVSRHLSRGDSCGHLYRHDGLPQGCGLG
jgi:hypothetical protein